MRLTPTTTQVTVARNNRREMLTICAAFFLAFLGAGACQPYVVSYLHEEKGLPFGQASLVLSMVYFTFVVFRFLIGFLIDVVGLHAAKIIGIATYALFPLVILAGNSLPVWLAGSVLWGIGAPMLWTSALVQVMNTSGPGRHATSAGIVRGTVMAAVLLGSYALAFVYARRDYLALFALAAVLGLAAIAAMACSPKCEVAREKPSLRKFFEVMASHEAKAVTVFLVCSGLAYGLLLNGIKTHIEAAHGKYWLELIIPCFSLAGIVTSFLGGRICERVGRWPTFTWGFVIGGSGMLLAWALPGPRILMVAMACIGVQFAIVPLSAFAWVGDHTAPSDRAAVMGYVFCFRDLGVAVAIQARGAVGDPATAFLVFAVISLVCAGAAFWVGRFIGSQEREE